MFIKKVCFKLYKGFIFVLGLLFYHIIPVVSTTVVLYMAFTGGFTLQIFIYYMYIVILTNILLGISIFSGK